MSHDPLASVMCAFEREFGADPSPPGSNSLKYTSATAASGRTGSDGNTPGPGLQGQESMVLSNGRVVRYRVEYGAVGFWTACELDYDEGRPTGIGRSSQSAVDDLRDWLEDELP